MVYFFFFFQAEDGIRDLVRSRGLGDVYKRQARMLARGGDFQRVVVERLLGDRRQADQHEHRVVPVSYTHLTLPTSDLV
mgnify:CR=1 FL=1